MWSQTRDMPWRSPRMKPSSTDPRNSTGQPNSRTAQVFINFGDNVNLDGLGFAPFAEVVEGMDVVDQLYSGYGEGAPTGRGPSQALVQAEGNRYLESQFPELDFIVGTSIVGD